MSALPPIADMCSATRYVRFVTIVGTKKKEAANHAANLRKKIFSGQAEDRYDRN